MYGLNCDYYEKEFPTIDELIQGVMDDGMDPNYEVTKDGEVTGEILFELMEV